MNYSCTKEETIFVYMQEQTVTSLESEHLLNEDQMTDDNRRTKSTAIEMGKN